mgnify:CR=1 FL=1
MIGKSAEAEKTIYANKEIILSAGAINSPHLLQLSGVGCSKLLQKIGGKIKHELPGVGENLRDHYQHALPAAWKV